jgi:membrane protease YdiL (CAAX protease family)
MMSCLFISPHERRLRAGWRLLIQALIFAIFAAIASILIFPALPEGWFFQLVKEVVRLLAITIPIYLARRFLDRRSFVSLGVDRKHGISRDILAGFLISGVGVSLLFVIFLAMGWLKVEGFAWQVDPWSRIITAVVIMLLIFAMTAWSEELQARGYWLQNLEEGLNLGWAFILSSLFFSLSHFLNEGFSWMAFLGVFVGSFDLAYGYIRTRRLWLPIGLHLGWNFFLGTIYGFAVSGLEGMPSLVLQSVSGPKLWTGGAFGPEAGLLMLLAVGVNVGFIYLYSQTSPAE